MATAAEARTLQNYIGGPVGRRRGRARARGPRPRDAASSRRECRSPERPTWTPRCGGPRRPAGLARGAAAGAGPRGARPARRAGRAPPGARRAGHRRHGQDARRRGRRGRARDRVGRVGGGDPPPAQGRDPRGGRHGPRRRAGPPAGRRGRRDHPLQLPGDDPALVPALRGRLRQRLHPQALGARPAPGSSGSAS